MQKISCQFRPIRCLFLYRLSSPIYVVQQTRSIITVNCIKRNFPIEILQVLYEVHHFLCWKGTVMSNRDWIVCSRKYAARRRPSAFSSEKPFHMPSISFRQLTSDATAKSNWRFAQLPPSFVRLDKTSSLRTTRNRRSLPAQHEQSQPLQLGHD